MSGFSLLLLASRFSANDLVECHYCGESSKLSLWGIEGEEMECPECREQSVVEEVVEEQGHG